MTGNDVTFAQDSFQSIGYTPKQQVTYMVAERIVDVLEIVEIKK